MMLFSKTIWLPGLLAICISGCKSEGTAAAKNTDEKSKPVPVQVFRVQPTAIARVLAYDADIQGSLEVKVFSQVPERILSMRVKEGDRVKKGQVLAMVRSDTLSANVSSATAALDAARADRDRLADELSRQQKLLAKKVVSQAMVDSLRLRLLAAEAQIRRMEALTQQAATARGNAFVKSPINGIVGRCYLDQGDLAMPTLPICTIVQMDKVRLLLEVPEAELARVSEGMTARVRVARFPEKDFAGTVTRIFPTIDRRTRTAQVNVELDNKDHQLMPGMLANVRLEVESHDKVVVILYSALIIEMGAKGKVIHRAYVVDAKNRAAERTVTLGIVDAKRVEVLSGLGSGDLLVTQGQHLLEPGKAVEVVERLGLDGKVVVDKGQKK